MNLSLIARENAVNESGCRIHFFLFDPESTLQARCRLVGGLNGDRKRRSYFWRYADRVRCGSCCWCRPSIRRPGPVHHSPPVCR